MTTLKITVIIPYCGTAPPFLLFQPPTPLGLSLICHFWGGGQFCFLANAQNFYLFYCQYFRNYARTYFARKRKCTLKLLFLSTVSQHHAPIASSTVLKSTISQPVIPVLAGYCHFDQLKFILPLCHKLLPILWA